jgi:RHS repeat-associated protein
LDGNVHSTTTSTGSTTLTATNAYDDLNRLLSLVNTGTTGNVISSYGYQYDAVGDITQVSEQSPDGSTRTANYSYDALNRLTEEKVTDGSGVHTTDYTYDLAGNRYSQTDASGTTYFYYYSENPEELRAQVTPDNTETDFYYDANGSLLTTALNNNGTPTVTASYTYDDRNRLVSATVNGQTESFTYDDDGNRVSSTTASGTTLYENDQQSPTGYSQVLAEKSASGAIQAAYAYGLQLIAQSRPASGTSIYLYDGHGSVRALANTSGNVTDTYTYDAFGNLTSPPGSTINVYLYSGQRFDSILGQYDLRAREYDPSIGRFTTLDDPRFTAGAGNFGNANAYIYVGDRPIIASDPTGHDDLVETLAVIAGRALLFTIQHPGLVTAIGLIANALLPDEFQDALIGSGIAPFEILGEFGRSERGTLKVINAAKNPKFKAILNRVDSALANRLYTSNTGLAQLFEDVFEKILPDAEPKVRLALNSRVYKQDADFVWRGWVLQLKTGLRISGSQLTQLSETVGYAKRTGRTPLYVFLKKPAQDTIDKIITAGANILYFFEQ